MQNFESGFVIFLQNIFYLILEKKKFKALGNYQEKKRQCKVVSYIKTSILGMILFEVVILRLAVLD